MFFDSSCKKTRKKAAAMLSGDTSALEKQWLQSHLKKCKPCEDAVNEMSELLETVKAQRFLPSPLERDRIFDKLSEQLDAPFNDKNKYAASLFQNISNIRRLAFAAVFLVITVFAVFFYATNLSKSMPLFSKQPLTIELSTKNEIENRIVQTVREAEQLFLGASFKAKYEIEHKENETVIHITDGTLWISYKRTTKIPKLTVMSSSGVVVHVTGTVLMVSAAPSGQMNVGVFNGKVLVVSEKEDGTELSSGQLRLADGQLELLHSKEKEQVLEWLTQVLEESSIKCEEHRQDAELSDDKQNFSLSTAIENTPSSKKALLIKSSVDLYAEAESKMTASDYSKAAQLLEKLVSAETNSAKADTARLDLARIYTEYLNQPQRAAFHLRTYLKRHPRSPQSALLEKIDHK